MEVGADPGQSPGLMGAESKRIAMRSGQTIDGVKLWRSFM